MAIEYVLYVEGSVDASLLDVLSDEIGMKRPDTSTGSLALYGSFSSIIVSGEDEAAADPALGWKPSYSFVFRLDKEHLREAEGQLVQAVSAIAVNVAGPLALLFNWENLVAWRRTSVELVLDRNFGVWTPELVRQFAVPVVWGAWRSAGG
ncbi:MAG: SitI3 family protein [Sandaracinaceae bacterium]